ncbi:hypothetical protein BVY00_00435 [bacterium G20]|nr:hypothetical protein BVY00_00435 [bacterium G20]
MCMAAEDGHELDRDFPITDDFLFGIDWAARTEEHFIDANAARGALKDLNSNPDLTVAERHARQKQAIEVHHQAMMDGLASATLVLTARDRAVELFTEPQA